MWGSIVAAALPVVGAGVSSLFGGGKSDSSGIRGAGEAAYGTAQQARFDNQAAADNANFMYNQALNYQMPWYQAGETGLDVGKNALLQYAGLLGVPGYQYIDPTNYLQNTPGYNFRFKEGLRALDRSAASKGMLLSGQQVKRAQEYGQGYATEIYNDLLNRLYSLSGNPLSVQGQQAATTMGNYGMDEARLVSAAKANMGNAIMQGGQSMGNSLMNQYNADAYGASQNQNSLMTMLGLGSAMASNALRQYNPGRSGYADPYAVMSANYANAYGG